MGIYLEFRAWASDLLIICNLNYCEKNPSYIFIIETKNKTA